MAKASSPKANAIKGRASFPTLTPLATQPPPCARARSIALPRQGPRPTLLSAVASEGWGQLYTALGQPRQQSRQGHTLGLWKQYGLQGHAPRHVPRHQHRLSLYHSLRWHHRLLTQECSSPVSSGSCWGTPPPPPILTYVFIS